MIFTTRINSYIGTTIVVPDTSTFDYDASEKSLNTFNALNIFMEPGIRNWGITFQNDPVYLTSMLKKKLF